MILVYTYMCMYVCKYACMMCMYGHAHDKMFVWRSEDNPVEPILPFHFYMDPVIKCKRSSLCGMCFLSKKPSQGPHISSLLPLS